MPVPPIDPSGTSRLALRGRVVTMDEGDRVLAGATIYVVGGNIAAVVPAGEVPPQEVADIPVHDTKGTIFPGLIELHNHLAYNALRLWDVPEKFANRDRWSGTPEYRRLITGPMKVLGASPGLMPALVRYVECKCLLGGVTTSQGVELFSNRGARRFYRGLVRNVEQTGDHELPDAVARIPDVDAKDAERFRERLLKQTSMLLHLSEGKDDKAREHFLSLHLEDGRWAIARSLIGIHCAALHREDFHVMHRFRGSMVWSPLSNLLLYGGTALVTDARAEGVRVGIGSDWSPSGSKNLLGELKAARIADDAANGNLRDIDIVAMATREAARILRWDKVLGALEAGKRADLIVIPGSAGDAYRALLSARESGLRLVMINGVPRFGEVDTMEALGAAGEAVKVGGKARRVNLAQASADPIVGALKLEDARTMLTDALHELPDLAKQLETPHPVMAERMSLARDEPPTWYLALDELEDTGFDLRPRLPLAGAAEPSGPTRAAAHTSVPLSQIVQPLDLDPLTVADDDSFLERLGTEKNLPPGYAAAVAALYG